MKTDMRDAFFLSLLAEARKDSSIIVLTGDHGAFPLEEFEKDLPNQYFNVGIAEQNMISVAAGLAKVGKIPFVYGITPFVSLRALEQITLDVCANKLPVNIVSVGAGFTYSTDGPTHHGLQDLAAISSIPGMTILNSSDPANTSHFVRQAIAVREPHYIRIEKEKLEDFVRFDSFDMSMEIGFSRIKSSKSAQVIIVSTGFMTRLAIDVAEKFRANDGRDVDVIDLHRIAPFPEGIASTLRRYQSIYVLEDSYRSVIARELALCGLRTGENLALRGVVDTGAVFYFQGDTRSGMHDAAGLSIDVVVNTIGHTEGW